MIQECTSKSQSPPWFLQKKKRVWESFVSSWITYLMLLSWQTRSESCLTASLCLWAQASTSGLLAVLAAPIGLLLVWPCCFSMVIPCDLHFFSCLMCSYLIRSWFCPSCLLFMYRYCFTKSRWLKLKGLIMPVMIVFYSGSSFLSVSGSVLSLASSVNSHAKYS